MRAAFHAESRALLARFSRFSRRRSPPGSGGRTEPPERRQASSASSSLSTAMPRAGRSRSKPGRSPKARRHRPHPRGRRLQRRPRHPRAAGASRTARPVPRSGSGAVTCAAVRMIQRNPSGTRRTFAVNPHDGSRLPSYGIIMEYAMVTTAFNLLETAGVETRQAEAIVSEMRGWHPSFPRRDLSCPLDSGRWHRRHRASVPADPGVRLLPKEAGHRGGRAGAATHADAAPFSTPPDTTRQVAER